MTEKKKSSSYWFMALFVAINLIALAAGFFTSDAIYPVPKIGIIHIDWEIDYSIQSYFLYPLNYAKSHDEIVAVVLLIDSPGGSAALSEEIFYQLLELRQEKPIIATINRLGASGAYYIASASNYIYSKPAAFVGSIGVISSAPRRGKPSESTLTTGPFKGSGSPLVDWVRGLEIIKDIFITNVYDQRIYALEHMHDPPRTDVFPGKDQVATGQIWVGSVAYDIGLVDAIGSNLDAIQKAADLANVKNYEVVDLTRLVIWGEETSIFSSTFSPELTTLDPYSLLSPEDSEDYIDAGPWQKFYFLYVPPTDEGE
jgi:protease-4